MSFAPDYNAALDILDTHAAPKAVIFGVAGTVLSDAERDFFARENPLGFILFARNCENPAQLRALTDDLRRSVERNAPILIDQEGGRVTRMKPPHWTAFPAAAHYGDLYAQDQSGGLAALAADTAKLAGELKSAGITVNCAPVLDVRYPDTHDAIGDRAYSADVAAVEILTAAAAAEYLASGIVPVIKHIPGQGRATLDSHKDLPRVATTMAGMDETDFAPYRHILRERFATALWGMVSHIVYENVDTQHPASCSATVIDTVIRGHLGFDGLLLSDDLSMDALALYGDAAGRAVHTLRAGCDIALHCNGKMDEMTLVAAQMPPMTDAAVARFNRTAQWLQQNRLAA